MIPYPVYAQSGPPEWWQILAVLGPWILLLAFGIVCFIWWLWVRQEAKAADRREWWSHAEWALEASLDENPKLRRAGRAVLDLLGRKASAGSVEARIVARTRQENASNGQGAENLPN